MADDLFLRAKGPRREVGGDYSLPCPWCGADNGDLDAEQNDDGSSTCVECSKEFVCPDDNGDLVCVGLLSPADMKYLAAKEAMPELDRQVDLAQSLIAAEPAEQRARYEAEARAQMTEARHG